MGCALELSLFVLGIWFCTRSRLDLGGQELKAPFTIFAGLILIIQLPITVGVGFALGAAEGIKSARTGTDPAVAQARFVKKYWWLDLALPGGAAVLAGGVVIAGRREPVYLPPPPDDPVGIVDYRRLMEEKHEATERAYHDEVARPRESWNKT